MLLLGRLLNAKAEELAPDVLTSLPISPRVAARYIGFTRDKVMVPPIRAF